MERSLRAQADTSIAWERYRAEFPIFRQRTYFNTCSLGALSTRVEAAVRQFTALWGASGAAAWYGPWSGEIEHLREEFAALIGAWPDEIAIFPSVTTALTAVASAYDYRERPRVVITDVGWFAHREQFAFDVTQFAYADGARRFEGGTPAVAAVYAGRAGIGIVAELGVARLRHRQIELASLVVEEARRRGLHPRTPARAEDLAGIVTIPRQDPNAVVASLARRGIIVDARPGVVRLSPYFYNTPEECARVVEAIDDLEKDGVA